MKLANRFWLAVAILLYLISWLEILSQGISPERRLINISALIGVVVGSLALLFGVVALLTVIIPKFNDCLNKLDN